MSQIYTFNEISEFWSDFEDWSVKDRGLSKLRNAHQTFRKMWDGVKTPEGFPMNETVIYELRRRFPSDESAQKGRPLGEFKDIMSGTHEEIFNSLLEQITRTRKNAQGERTSYLTEMKFHCRYLWEDYFPESEKKWLKWDESVYTNGFALMLYGSSIGIYLEDKVHVGLTTWLESQPKASEVFSYERADSDCWESKDVDGIFRVRATGDIAVKVSIKCLGALEEKFIHGVYRNKKRKIEPDIYLGYRYLNSEKLKTVEVDGKLKELLRRSL